MDMEGMSPKKKQKTRHSSGTDEDDRVNDNNSAEASNLQNNNAINTRGHEIEAQRCASSITLHGSPESFNLVPQISNSLQINDTSSISIAASYGNSSESITGTTDVNRPSAKITEFFTQFCAELSTNENENFRDQVHHSGELGNNDINESLIQCAQIKDIHCESEIQAKAIAFLFFNADGSILIRPIINLANRNKENEINITAASIISNSGSIKLQVVILYKDDYKLGQIKDNENENSAQNFAPIILRNSSSGKCNYNKEDPGEGNTSNCGERTAPLENYQPLKIRTCQLDFDTSVAMCSMINANTSIETAACQLLTKKTDKYNVTSDLDQQAPPTELEPCSSINNENTEKKGRQEDNSIKKVAALKEELLHQIEESQPDNNSILSLHEMNDVVALPEIKDQQEKRSSNNCNEGINSLLQETSKINENVRSNISGRYQTTSNEAVQNISKTTRLLSPEINQYIVSMCEVDKTFTSSETTACKLFCQNNDKKKCSNLTLQESSTLLDYSGIVRTEEGGSREFNMISDTAFSTKQELPAQIRKSTPEISSTVSLHEKNVATALPKITDQHRSKSFLNCNENSNLLLQGFCTKQDTCEYLGSEKNIKNGDRAVQNISITSKLLTPEIMEYTGPSLLMCELDKTPTLLEKTLCYTIFQKTDNMDSSSLNVQESSMSLEACSSVSAENTEETSNQVFNMCSKVALATKENLLPQIGKRELDITSTVSGHYEVNSAIALPEEITNLQLNQRIDKCSDSSNLLLQGSSIKHDLCSSISSENISKTSDEAAKKINGKTNVLSSKNKQYQSDILSNDSISDYNNATTSAETNACLLIFQKTHDHSKSSNIEVQESSTPLEPTNSVQIEHTKETGSQDVAKISNIDEEKKVLPVIRDINLYIARTNLNDAVALPEEITNHHQNQSADNYNGRYNIVLQNSSSTHKPCRNNDSLPGIASAVPLHEQHNALIFPEKIENIQLNQNTDICNARLNLLQQEPSISHEPCRNDHTSEKNCQKVGKNNKKKFSPARLLQSSFDCCQMETASSEQNNTFTDIERSSLHVSILNSSPNLQEQPFKVIPEEDRFCQISSGPYIEATSVKMKDKWCRQFEEESILHQVTEEPSLLHLVPIHPAASLSKITLYNPLTIQLFTQLPRNASGSIPRNFKASQIDVQQPSTSNDSPKAAENYTSVPIVCSDVLPQGSSENISLENEVTDRDHENHLEPITGPLPVESFVFNGLVQETQNSGRLQQCPVDTSTTTTNDKKMDANSAARKNVAYDTMEDLEQQAFDIRAHHKYRFPQILSYPSRDSKQSRGRPRKALAAKTSTPAFQSCSYLRNPALPIICVPTSSQAAMQEMNSRVSAPRWSSAASTRRRNRTSTRSRSTRSRSTRSRSTRSHSTGSPMTQDHDLRSSQSCVNQLLSDSSESE